LGGSVLTTYKKKELFLRDIMKIKFDVEIDTQQDKDIGDEIIGLLKLLAERLEQLNDEDWD